MFSTQLSFSGENLLFCIFVLIHRIMTRCSKNSRPSSAPYVSGDSFRFLANHVFENNADNFDPLQVKERDIVFVKLSSALYFFQHIHPQIKNKYILLLHNNDNVFDKKMASYIDQRILVVFSQNVEIKHPKVIPIPIGLENYSYYNHGAPAFFEKLQAKLSKKKNAILYGFSVHTNKVERLPALKYISQHPCAVEVPTRLNAWRYLQVLSRYKFVLSPPGNGLDCIRTWEALYLGVIPIVKRSVAMEYFAKIGLPIWIVDNWKELDGYTNSQLSKRYAEMIKEADYTGLYFPYWKYKVEQFFYGDKK